MAERCPGFSRPTEKRCWLWPTPAVSRTSRCQRLLFGDETRGFQAQVDSVWDVAVSPDWKWIGFGRAYGVVGGEGTGTDLLTDVSRRTSIDTATLRAGSFASSGMSMSRAVAQPGVIRIPDDPRQVAAADSAAPRLFPIARGWQVRWTTDGKTLALGNSPARATDDEPSQSWSALDPVTGALSVALPSNASLPKRSDCRPDAGSIASDQHDQSPPIQIRRGTQTFTIQSNRGVSRSWIPWIGSTGLSESGGGDRLGGNCWRAIHHRAGTADTARCE